VQAIENSSPMPTGAPSGRRVGALLSYSHAVETTSAARLATELRLRGVQVVRDVEAFESGEPVDSAMAAAVASDLVVSHLTPEALASDVVVSQELVPALRGQRDQGRPAVVFVPHGLGADHAEVEAAAALRLKASVSAKWVPVIVEDRAEPLTVEVSASVARAALRRAVASRLSNLEGLGELHVLTHGTPSAPDALVVDGTELLGGPARRVGTPEDWARLYDGLFDVADVLGAGRRSPGLDVVPRCHLSAAVMCGFVFRRAAGWKIAVRSRDGDLCAQSSTPALGRVRCSPIDPGPADDGRLFVEISLAGQSIEAAVDSVIERTGVPMGRLRFWRPDGELADLTPNEIGALAAAIGLQVKRARGELRAARVEFFIAAPASFGVLLGAELNSLGVPAGLHEHAAEDTYVHVFDLPGGST
jgi:hypothetical protein